ncbi:MAG: ABC transporter ATP-binding protein, partial [Alphaproteobacteria bacterium]
MNAAADTASQGARNLITVRDLRITFDQHGKGLEVVKGVTFRIAPGKTVALVGESGAGKSVIGQSIIGILPKIAQITGGEILFADPRRDDVIDLARIDPESRSYRKIRGGRISIIFQEPMTSLSAFHTIGDQISEALFLHRDVARQEGLQLVVEMLELCGFPQPAEAVKRYPFELSGGLRQRAMIAMALVCHPALLIADEPTTALDVSVQAQILKLIKDLQKKLNMAVLMITHDLGVVANMADEVIVLFHGKIVESGSVEDIFTRPKHPYLKGLFGAVPHFDMKPGERLISPADLSQESAAQPKAAARGRRAKKPASKAGAAPRVLLEVRHLTKEFTARKGGFLSA